MWPLIVSVLPGEMDSRGANAAHGWPARPLRDLKLVTAKYPAGAECAPTAGRCEPTLRHDSAFALLAC